MKTNLEKLQNLCDIVNIRYSKGLNDDDQVKKMFEFEKKQNEAIIVIGWDTYWAISVEEYNKLYNLAICAGNIKKEFETHYFDAYINNKKYKCLIKN